MVSAGFEPWPPETEAGALSTTFKLNCRNHLLTILTSSLPLQFGADLPAVGGGVPRDDVLVGLGEVVAGLGGPRPGQHLRHHGAAAAAAARRRQQGGRRSRPGRRGRQAGPAAAAEGEGAAGTVGQLS